MATDEEDSSGSGDRPREPEVEEAFDRLVSEGSDRLDRPLVPLLVTGFVGGIDVGPQRAVHRELPGAGHGPDRRTGFVVPPGPALAGRVSAIWSAASAW
jgi:hypothetical protein